MQTVSQIKLTQIVLMLLRKTAEGSISWEWVYEQQFIDACKREINAGDSLGSEVYRASYGQQYLRVFYYRNQTSLQLGTRAIARDGYVYQLDVYNPKTLAPVSTINSSSALFDLFNSIKNSETSLNTLFSELLK